VPSSRLTGGSAAGLGTAVWTAKAEPNATATTHPRDGTADEHLLDVASLLIFTP
jgi:hypothetical protein